MKKRIYASADCRLRPGKARNYIIKLADLQPNQKVILCCRVSDFPQNFRGNLDDQKAGLQRAAENHGGNVIAIFLYVGSGCDPGWLETLPILEQEAALQNSRPVMVACVPGMKPACAVDLAIENSAVLLAETTCRFIRHRGFHTEYWPDAQAREHELQDLRIVTSGVPLMTLLDPEASPSDVRSLQSKRGQHEKGRFGGRPKSKRPGEKKFLRQKWLGTVRKLRRKGRSLREIAQELSCRTGRRISHSTIQDWISRLD